ncbi:MAG: hypothetical protein KGZ74_15850 [Chitinophagaceae bacterium]|nr:hypothetical protein [Chitinophagaceae bacterium]
MFIFKRVFSFFGLDQAIFFATTANGISAIGNVVSIILILKNLSILEQGYYYTFLSIAAIQSFFEMGLNGIIVQYVAYEKAQLHWQDQFRLFGNIKSLSRLKSLFLFFKKWYSIFGILLLLSLITVGYLFFTRYDNDNVQWFWPWVFLCSSVTVSFCLSPILAFIQGLGLVKEATRIVLFQTIFRLSTLWIFLFLDFKLYSLSISSLVASVFVLSLIFAKFKKIWFFISEIVVTEKINYKNEILPYQWRIAVSWISGFFIFQLFNPVLFVVEGPVIAGQMGMTLSVLNGILSVSTAWISTRIPLFSTHIANLNYQELDISFKRTLYQSTIVNIGCLLIFFFIVYFLRVSNFTYLGRAFSERFLDYFPLSLMMLTIVINHIIACFATYLRCHKRDPFFIYSFITAVLNLLSTLILGQQFGLLGLTVGYFLIVLISFPVLYAVYKKKKYEWHLTEI